MRVKSIGVEKFVNSTCDEIMKIALKKNKIRSEKIWRTKIRWLCRNISVFTERKYENGFSFL
jgi:hypothetical protein